MLEQMLLLFLQLIQIVLVTTVICWFAEVKQMRYRVGLLFVTFLAS